MHKINKVAISDSELYMQKMGEVFKEMIYIFSEFSDVFAWQGLDQMPAEEVFARIFAGFNLTQVSDINLPKDFIIPKFNLQEIIKLVFRKAYTFGHGGNIEEEYIRYFLNYIHIYLNLVHIYYPAFQGRPIRSSEDSILRKVSETFAINTSLVKSRKYLEGEYMRYLILNTPASVPIRVITDFTDITHQGVLKNIHSGNLAATKIKNNWQIPVQDAVTFLRKRKDCPNWILQL